MGEGLRYNEGKTRHDLVPSYAQLQYAKVLSYGASKYEPRNWQKGMKWSSVLASLKRHIEAFEMGEDYDKETGLLHTAHIMCNAGFLTEYYKIYPQGDDRQHDYLIYLKIGLDVDDVIADFVGAMMERFPEIENSPLYWNDINIRRNIYKIKDDNDFWLNIKPKTTSIPFEPTCYVTSRPIPSEITERWLSMNGFPVANVYTIGHGESKLDILKREGVDIFIDDKYDTFVELNKNGICCFLFDAPHNRRYNVGYKRITSLSDVLPQNKK